MGRIKTALVKRTSRKLLTEENAFSQDFNRNKKVLGNDTMPSKKVRNQIAGYISRLNTMKANEKQRLAEIAEKANQREQQKIETRQY
jgi:ribosomal protein S17E